MKKHNWIVSVTIIILLFAAAVLLTTAHAAGGPFKKWTVRLDILKSELTTIKAVTFGNNLFVAVCDNGFIYTSSNGTEWTKRSSGTTKSLSKVRYLNNKYIAVGDDGIIITSPDGIAWSTVSSGTTVGLNDIAFGNDTYVITANNRTLFTSADLITWASQTINLTNNYGDNDIYGIIFVNDGFYAVSREGQVISSPDGTEWAITDIPGSMSPLSIAYGSGLYVAAGKDLSSAIYTSSDGESWTSVTTGFTYLNEIIYAGDTFIAVDTLSSSYFASTNGIAWTKYKNSPSLKFGIAYGNNTYVLAAGGRIYQSAAGTTTNNNNNTTATPAASINTKKIDFGILPITNTGHAAVTISNTGSGTLTITGVTIKGVKTDEFARTYDCTSLDPGEYCTVDLTLNPTSYGLKGGVLEITSNAKTVNVFLIGIVPPPIVSAPKSVKFTSISAGQTTTKEIKVQNKGAWTLTIADINITGTNADEFSLIHDCETVAAGGYCTVNLTASPTSAGTKKAAIVISSDDPKRPELTIKIGVKAK